MPGGNGDRINCVISAAAVNPCGFGSVSAAGAGGVQIRAADRGDVRVIGRINVARSRGVMPAVSRCLKVILPLRGKLLEVRVIAAGVGGAPRPRCA